VPDKIATRLIRISLDADRGRLRYPQVLAIGTRAALFADLAFAGCLVDGGRSPQITGAVATGDRILDTLRAAVGNQPGHLWRRWFTYVRVDREAVCRELVAEEMWTAERSRRGLLPTTRYRDLRPDAALTLVGRTLEVTEYRRAPQDGPEAVLAGLCVICGSITGRPRPRAMETELLRLLDVVGTLQDPTRRAVQAALDSAASAVRRKRSR
jgi:Golgi phosphoprotein 3 (GPP34)